MKLASAAVLVLGAWAASASAADVWIVRGSAATATGLCVGVVWQGETLFYNRGNGIAEVRLLHQSNGRGSIARTVSIAAGESLSANASGFVADPIAPLSVARFDVPPEVAIDSRLDLYGGELCLTGHPPSPIPYGHIALPTFRTLVTAGEEQVHTGTDLALKPVRLNVAVYNAGDVAATAEITLHWPFCSAAASEQQVVAIPADTIVQVPIATRPPSCVVNPFGPAWSSYVTVRVDQRSLSFVSSIANGVDPDTNAAIRAGSR